MLPTLRAAVLEKVSAPSDQLDARIQQHCDKNVKQLHALATLNTEVGHETRNWFEQCSSCCIAFGDLQTSGEV